MNDKNGIENSIENDSSDRGQKTSNERSFRVEVANYDLNQSEEKSFREEIRSKIKFNRFFSFIFCLFPFLCSSLLLLFVRLTLVSLGS